MTEPHDDRIHVHLVIDNRPGNLSRIVLEPWAEEIKLRPGDQVDLLASGPASNACIEQEYRGDLLILSAFPGWIFSVNVNGKAMPTASGEIPSI